jgi:hypothetical protein
MPSVRKRNTLNITHIVTESGLIHGGTVGVELNNFACAVKIQVFIECKNVIKICSTYGEYIYIYI